MHQVAIKVKVKDLPKVFRDNIIKHSNSNVKSYRAVEKTLTIHLSTKWKVLGITNNHPWTGASYKIFLRVTKKKMVRENMKSCRTT